MFIVSLTAIETLAFCQYSFNEREDAMAFAKASEKPIGVCRAAVHEIRNTSRGMTQFETDYESPFEAAYQLARANAAR